MNRPALLKLPKLSFVALRLNRSLFEIESLLGTGLRLQAIKAFRANPVTRWVE